VGNLRGMAQSSISHVRYPIGMACRSLGRLGSCGIAAALFLLRTIQLQSPHDQLIRNSHGPRCRHSPSARTRFSPPWGRAAWARFIERDTRLGRDVAVKTIPPSCAGDPDRLPADSSRKHEPLPRSAIRISARSPTSAPIIWCWSTSKVNRCEVRSLFLRRCA
jgi:hypothetical protein